MFKSCGLWHALCIAEVLFTVLLSMPRAVTVANTTELCGSMPTEEIKGIRRIAGERWSLCVADVSGSLCESRNVPVNRSVHVGDLIGAKQPSNYHKTLQIEQVLLHC